MINRKERRNLRKYKNLAKKLYSIKSLKLKIKEVSHSLLDTLSLKSLISLKILMYYVSFCCGLKINVLRKNR